MFERTSATGRCLRKVYGQVQWFSFLTDNLEEMQLFLGLCQRPFGRSRHPSDAPHSHSTSALLSRSQCGARLEEKTSYRTDFRFPFLLTFSQHPRYFKFYPITKSHLESSKQPHEHRQNGQSWYAILSSYSTRALCMLHASAFTAGKHRSLEHICVTSRYHRPTLSHVQWHTTHGSALMNAPASRLSCPSPPGTSSLRPLLVPLKHLTQPRLTPAQSQSSAAIPRSAEQSSSSNPLNPPPQPSPTTSPAATPRRSAACTSISLAIILMAVLLPDRISIPLARIMG